MRQRPSREPLGSGSRFDSLETRAMMTHVPAGAAVQAHLVQAEQAAEVRAAVQAAHHHHSAPGQAALPAVSTGTNRSSGGNDLGPVSNTFSALDINSNYIGGSIGLQAFVDGLYRNILNRTPSSGEEAFWTGELESGAFLPHEVVNDFLTSSEAVQNGGNGEPFNPSIPPLNIYTSFLGGPIGVTSFVDGLYLDVLHTDPDPAGEAFWVGQIENHDILPAKITFTFLAEQPGLS